MCVGGDRCVFLKDKKTDKGATGERDRERAGKERAKTTRTGPHVTTVLQTCHVFHNVRYSEKLPSASHDDVNARLGQDKNWPQGLALFVGA